MRTILCLLFLWTLAAYAAPQIVLQSGSGNHVYAMAAASNGLLYATGDDGGVVKVRERLGHTVWQSFTFGGRRITRLLFSPSNTTLFVVGEAGIAAWSLKEQRFLWRRDGGVYTAVWRPDGNAIEVIALGQKHLSLDAKTGAETVLEPVKGRGYQVQTKCELSPDGKLLASDGYEPDGQRQPGTPPTRGVILDAESAQHRVTLRGVRGHLMKFDFSPDSARLFVSSLDNKEITNGRPANWGQIFDAKSGALLRSMRLFDDSNAIMDYTAWSPDGKLLATVGRDARDRDSQSGLKIWDAETGQIVHQISDETRTLSRYSPVWVSREEVLLSVVKSEQSVRSYGVETFYTRSGKSRLWFEPRLVRLDTPRWSPDGRFLTLRSPLAVNSSVSFRAYSTLRIWDTTSGALQSPPWGAEPKVSVQLLDSEIGIGYKSTPSPGAEVRRWLWTPDGSLLVTDNFEAWQWPSGPLLQKLPPPKIPTLAPNASPEQREEFSKAIRIAWTLPGGSDCDVVAMDAAPDNRTIAFGCLSARSRFSGFDEGPKGNFSLWDARSNALTLLDSLVDVNWLAFSPDGKHLAALVSRAVPGRGERKPGQNVERTNAIEVWDMSARRRVAQKPSGQMWDIWKTPLVVGWIDNQRLLLQSRKQSPEPLSGFKNSVSFTHLETWDFATEQVAQFEPLRVAGEVSRGSSVSLDLLATASLQSGKILVRDGKVCHWHRLRDGAEIGRVPFEAPYYAEPPQIAPDGKFAALSKTDGTVELWRIAPEGKSALAATLALLPAKTGEAPDWLLYTPDGFYDGSPNAHAQILWRDGEKLLPATTFPERRKTGLLGEIFQGKL